MNKLPRGYDAWKTASPYDDLEMCPDDNSAVEKAFNDYAGPYDLYRSVYKSTACGPTVGFTFYGEWGPGDNGESGPASTYEPPCNRTFYCDDLHQFGTWELIAEHGFYIVEIHVSSIVEGVDQCTESHHIDCDPYTFKPEEIRDAFWQAVEAVDREADEIWHDTHGCETCAKHWADMGTPFHHTWLDKMEGCDGITIIWDDCPDCGGHGVCI